MKNVINWVLACLVFVASFTCYAMGNESGTIILILAGFFSKSFFCYDVLIDLQRISLFLVVE